MNAMGLEWCRRKNPVGIPIKRTFKTELYARLNCFIMFVNPCCGVERYVYLFNKIKV